MSEPLLRVSLGGMGSLTSGGPLFEISRASDDANDALAWLKAVEPEKAGLYADDGVGHGLEWLVAAEMAKYPSKAISAAVVGDAMTVILHASEPPPPGLLRRWRFRITPNFVWPSEDHGWLIADIDDPDHGAVASTFDEAFELALSSAGERR